AVPARALTPPRLDESRLAADVLRAGGGAETVRVVAMAAAEGGGERRIAVADAGFAADERTATAVFDLPSDLIGQVTRVALAERPSAGGAALADASIRRVRTAVVDPDSEAAVAPLTSARHYLTQALNPWADVLPLDLEAALDADAAAIFLADQGEFTDDVRERLTEWVEAGGLLVRFAGPRVAAAVGDGGLGFVQTSGSGDPLLPVALRRGGRVLGGALSWGAPKTLGPLAGDGPFGRLEPPDEVSVRTQVLAEPSPDLAGKVWATLDDGTPLVTSAERGEGRVVLFHVSADAEWSSLPLSGLFVEMLGRLVALAPGRIADRPSAGELAGTLWRPELMLGPAGAPRPASDMAETVTGEALAEGHAGPGTPPGLYARADGAERAAGAAETLALSLHRAGDTLEPLAPPPAAVLETLGGAEALALGPWLLALALLLIALDTIATLWISGRLGIGRRQAAAAGLVLAVAAAASAADAAEGEIAAATETTLGYVLTGDPQIDRVSEAAMRGLGAMLARRTAVEPGPTVGVDPETDALSLYPVLYWPLAERTVPPEDGLAALGRYLQNGGMLIVDTQDGASGLNGIPAPTMRQVARALNLPPLAPVDGDHVLTRSFYLLDRFPGRWRGGRVWIEAPPPEAEEREDEPDLPRFDRVDDNVSPVIVGSADWAAAWAIDEQGYPLFPVGRPGDQQRELAFRFGINAVMYALTGNYKSDQVHAPAVLERLGQ
ncbi:MAG TPA: DUF4159 domain-containing protein, partial [Thermohalobaculum sp.]|nr:DUF4159 domain-containing protein [Thermohalobaculum sp.]